jgi:hypothetical protein
LEKRRTNASFLSDEEAARESKRTEDFVRSIAGTESTRMNVCKKKQMPKEQKSTCSAENSTANVGELDQFEVDFDRQSKIISIYGKEVPNICQLKLKIRMSETRDLICLLEKAKTIFDSQKLQTIGEGKGFTVDYDCVNGLILVYKKEVSKVQYKLAFTQNEIPTIIALLRKARSML